MNPLCMLSVFVCSDEDGSDRLVLLLLVLHQPEGQMSSTDWTRQPARH